MSKVIAQAKKKYQITLQVECLFLLVLTLILACWQWQRAVSFLLGFLSAFIPFVFFALFIFFKNNHKSKMAAFYRGEAIKFFLTIIFIIMSFKLFVMMDFIVFFAGYFTALLFNNLVPFLLSKYFKL